MMPEGKRKSSTLLRFDDGGDSLMIEMFTLMPEIAGGCRAGHWRLLL
jgi:hypothetical protein